MTEEKHNEKWLLVSDVDDTILGDETALVNLAGKLSRYRQDIVVVYNSSRPCVSVRTSIEDHAVMPDPDYLIGALGTEIEEMQSGHLDKNYSRQLDIGWDRASINNLMVELGFQLHDDEYQTAYKASYHVPEVTDYQKAVDRLEARHLRAKVIYSGGKNLDLIPQNAGKGAAVIYLSERLNIPIERVVVAGDSGNDVDMFSYNFKGIVVGNADDDLRRLSSPRIYQAKADHAQGVLEGLHFWGVIP